MKKIENVFGKGTIYEEKDLKGKIYVTCAACMSLWSDLLSFANKHKERFTNNPDVADTIVVLGCQVTDLVILNDLNVAERLCKKYNKEIYMGGCIAQRFDIKLPKYIKRLDVIRELYQDIDDFSLIHFEKPFWVTDFEESEDDLKEGNLFRNFYPLQIGAGCNGNCKYCTIKHTRGDVVVLPPENQIEIFLKHDKVVLISDNPTASQIKGWSRIAIEHNKSFSIRNIEPQNLVRCKEELLELADKKLLKILHCPIQSFDDELLEAMNRDVKSTKEALELILELRNKGVITATNIIIDYTHNGKFYKNLDKELLDKYFDYYSWNPYFDGTFDLEKAKQRFKKYIIERDF